MPVWVTGGAQWTQKELEKAQRGAMRRLEPTVRCGTSTDTLATVRCWWWRRSIRKATSSAASTAVSRWMPSSNCWRTSDLLAPVPAQPGDLPIATVQTRMGGGMMALGTFTLRFDRQRGCLYLKGRATQSRHGHSATPQMRTGAGLRLRRQPGCQARRSVPDRRRLRIGRPPASGERTCGAPGTFSQRPTRGDKRARRLVQNGTDSRRAAHDHRDPRHVLHPGPTRCGRSSGTRWGCRPPIPGRDGLSSGHRRPRSAVTPTSRSGTTCPHLRRHRGHSRGAQPKGVEFTTEVKDYGYGPTTRFSCPAASRSSCTNPTTNWTTEDHRGRSSLPLRSPSPAGDGAFFSHPQSSHAAGLVTRIWWRVTSPIPTPSSISANPAASQARPGNRPACPERPAGGVGAEEYLIGMASSTIKRTRSGRSGSVQVRRGGAPGRTRA